jgi:hypothetical protein
MEPVFFGNLSWIYPSSTPNPVVEGGQRDTFVGGDYLESGQQVASELFPIEANHL